ncbi:Spc98 family-domain-containing protein [Sphaerosporella brunnea]|uniref:Spindle pole body component n=1 Tax=Sphaerosporella brunnea TaxID=1250544 RepID=A0A5J5ER57_9PEZI|nr:Spc98 family-domain-containing protein [Sphaerosporella brunnea]
MTTVQLKLKALVERLIEHETGLTAENDEENFNIARKYTLNKFKTHKFGRTNQFDVISRLEGLEEKFRILNAEPLANALESRIDELKSLTDIRGANNFVPETLQLLLELSDEPLKKTRLSDFDKLKRSPPPKELTWADIIAEEPLEGDIWQDVDFAAESSDAWSGDEMVLPIRERLRRAGKDVKNTSTAKRRKRRRAFDDHSSDEEEKYRVMGVDGLVVEGDKEGLESLKSAQYWERKVEATEKGVDVALGAPTNLDDVWIVSELQALREVIFMLLGHPCALLRKGHEGDKSIVWIDPMVFGKRFVLRHTSLGGFESVLGWFAAKGTSLNRIRAFTQATEESPERQSFIASVEDKLAELDKKLIAIEAKYVGKGAAETVSLIALQSQLEPLVSPFDTLCRIIQSLNNSSHLEQLYLSACALQSTGNIPSYTFIATIFFSCLRTYLRPIRQWMEAGVMPPTDDFLVSQTVPDDTLELGTFWHSQFQLRRTSHGSLSAPCFVHPVAQRILTTGKSVIFLKHLIGSSSLPEAAVGVNDHTEITFSDVCVPGADLAPFSSLFLAAFNRWIGARHHSISARLRRHLFDSCGLWRSLDALDLVFFARNGYVFETLAQGIFEKLDRKAATWSDRFLLTEQIQSVFSSTPEVDSHRLRMGVKTRDLFARRADTAGRKNVDTLSNIEVDYRLPWPVVNILRPSTTFPTYRRVFTFLLQLRRARYLLERIRRNVNAEKTFLALKQRFLWFSATVVMYVTDLVLRPLTERLRRDMANADDIDAMVAVHDSFVTKVGEWCLLGPKLKPIHDAIISVLNLAVTFVRMHDSTFRTETADPPSPRRRRRAADEDVESSDDDAPPPPSPGSSAARSVVLEDGEGEDDGEDRLGKMLEEMVGLTTFVKEGLRGVARAGVMPHLEMLAEALEGYGAGNVAGVAA